MPKQACPDHAAHPCIIASVQLKVRQSTNVFDWRQARRTAFEILIPRSKRSGSPALHRKGLITEEPNTVFNRACQNCDVQGRSAPGPRRARPQAGGHPQTPCPSAESDTLLRWFTGGYVFAWAGGWRKPDVASSLEPKWQHPVNSTSTSKTRRVHC